LTISTAIITHPACLGHQPPDGHPERPRRLSAVLDSLAGAEFQGLSWLEAPRATVDTLARAHDESVVEAILGAMDVHAGQGEYVSIDGDTIMSAGSAEAALRAAGAGVLAVDEVMAGRYRNAFCAVRPPGHHAERFHPMGFCLFNNVAVAALHARAVHGVGRIAIVDFDVHHGNGTQDIFWNDQQTFYVSTHQSPLYPGTGAADERGAHSNTLNLPLAPGSDGAVFRAILEQAMLPALERFSPEFLFISAGFDAYAGDPLADLRLTDADFAFATHMLCTFAAESCGGRVVSALEGGYDLGALGLAAAAHVRTLMEF